MGSGYDKTDAAKATDASTSKVSEAWHQAKDDAAKEGGWRVPADRHAGKDKGSNNSGK